MRDRSGRREDQSCSKAGVLILSKPTEVHCGSAVVGNLCCFFFADNDQRTLGSEGNADEPVTEPFLCVLCVRSYGRASAGAYVQCSVRVQLEEKVPGIN